MTGRAPTVESLTDLVTALEARVEALEKRLRPPMPAPAKRTVADVLNDADAHPYGLVVDPIIAQVVGCRVGTVHKYRRAAGVKPCVPPSWRPSEDDCWQRLLKAWGEERALAWFDRFAGKAAARAERKRFERWLSARKEVARG